MSDVVVKEDVDADGGDDAALLIAAKYRRSRIVKGVECLASCVPDVWAPAKRRQYAEEVARQMLAVVDQDEDNGGGGGGGGEWTTTTTLAVADIFADELYGVKCSSPHAHRRVVPLVLRCLLRLLRSSPPSSSSAAAGRRAGGTEKDEEEEEAAAVAWSAKKIASLLVRLLSESKNVELTATCRRQLLPVPEDDDDALLLRLRRQVSEYLGDDGGDWNVEDTLTTSATGAAIVAVVVGSSLDDNDKARTDAAWIDALLRRTTASAGKQQKPFAKLEEMELAQPFLLSSPSLAAEDGCDDGISSPADTSAAAAAATTTSIVTLAQWNDAISPVLQQKLKSHPEKSAAAVVGWILYGGMPRDAPLTDDWTALLLKQLTQQKDLSSSDSARKALVHWATTSCGSSRSFEAASVGLSKSLASATLAPVRLTLYRTLEGIAAAALKTSSAGASVDAASVDAACKSVVDAIVTRLNKETSVNKDQKAAGHQTLVQWLVLAKKRNAAEAYRSSLAYIRSVIAASSGAGNSGSKSGGKSGASGSGSNDAGILLGLLVERVHPDLLESIASDLYSDKQFEKGLEAIATEATGSKSKLSTQVDGLLAVYFALLYASSEKDKPIPKFAATLLASGSAKKESAASFLFAKVLIDTVATNPIVSLVVPCVVQQYVQLIGTTESNKSLPNLFAGDGKITAAARALAAAIAYPSTMTTSTSDGTAVTTATSSKDQYASNALASCLETVLTYQPSAAEGLIQAAFEQLNDSALFLEDAADAALAASQSDSDVVTVTPASTRRDVVFHAVRRAARLLSVKCKSPERLSKALVLMHAGSTSRLEGHQRAALILNTRRTIQEEILPLEEKDGSEKIRSAIADEIVFLSTSYWLARDKSGGDSNEQRLSGGLHAAALSLISSLGGIASNYSPSDYGEDVEDEEEMKPYVCASKLCVGELSSRLCSRLDETLAHVEELSMSDVGLFWSPVGSLFENEEDAKASAEMKKVGGKHLTEDEQWELQMKKELEEKRLKEGGGGAKELSAEQKQKIAEQDERREYLSRLMDEEFPRALGAIRSLVASDIEVGNECLPVLMESVLASATSTCPAISEIPEARVRTYFTLKTLAASVFEIDEMHALTISQALLLSYRPFSEHDASLPLPPVAQSSQSSGSKGGKRVLEVSQLPSPCAPAACVVYEMDHVHDALSGPSFAFLFPILRACLMGPRTPPGCEAALRVLGRHADLFAADNVDSRIVRLRRDMAASVLELLKHDRSQTFVDPTPYDVLVSCYRTDSSGTRNLTAAELAPLLDERGSLGTKNCRIGSMLVLSHIAAQESKIVKSNPLVENRIWVNCFDQEDDIRRAARQAWKIVHGIVVEENGGDDVASLPAPSLMYAAPLLPLLSHDNRSIASAAAKAYAQAMEKHPKSVPRNVEALCKAYIDAYPSSIDDAGDEKKPMVSATKTPAAALKAPSAAPVKKISTGIPKKKPAVKKSALGIAGIGKPKTAKKKAVSAALLKPKQERTLDHAALADQFKTTEKKSEGVEKDTPAKASVRMGVLHAIAAITDSSVQVDVDERTLELLASFLMAFGIAEGSDDLRGAARNALRDLVASKGDGEQAVAALLPRFESVLKTGIAEESAMGSLDTEKVPKSIAASDRRKEGAVVALGSVALHLKGPENASKIDNTIDMLISTLKTPSEDVQLSVAESLSKLMKKGNTQDRIETILSDLLSDCQHGSSLAVQRGGAYGLSAAVKGSGIATLKKYGIIKQLEEGCSSGSSSVKEGSLFAIELLCGRLGLLFEPYVIALLPSLLKAFSDSSDHVRKAAADTVGLIMSKLSAHGVKLVMPAVLTAFEDPAWRTKQASIQMLGSMSHLAPKQLASALPKVVPKLTEAFGDTHPKVKASAQDALVEISSVIRNPEISSISPVLLSALTDPADNTAKALETLIATEFLHAIDAPSLALIVPLLHRGLRDRGATTKRASGLIAGNITSTYCLHVLYFTFSFSEFRSLSYHPTCSNGQRSGGFCPVPIDTAARPSNVPAGPNS